jgi:hypothetical protein
MSQEDIKIIIRRISNFSITHGGKVKYTIINISGFDTRQGIFGIFPCINLEIRGGDQLGIFLFFTEH